MGHLVKPHFPDHMADNKIFQFKLVLLGESAVGKSSLVLRFVKGQFLDFQESTIGAAFLTQTVCLNDTTVKFEIWDTAGQERYHSLAPMYYRGAQAAIVVYDITNADSFDRAKKLGQGTSAPRQPQHCHFPCCQQGRSRVQTCGQCGDGSSLRRRKWFALYGDLG